LNGHQAYMSGSRSKNQKLVKKCIGDVYEGSYDPNGQQLEDKGEVVFKNGAVYKGQWLGDMKHGYGV